MSATRYYYLSDKSFNSSAEVDSMFFTESSNNNPNNENNKTTEEEKDDDESEFMPYTPNSADRSSVGSIPWADDAIKQNQLDWERIERMLSGLEKPQTDEGSAKDAFNLIMRNFLRTIALDKVTDFIFFLSKLLLTGAAGVGTYFFCMNTPELRLNYLAVPTTIVVIFAFLITSVFFDVYGMAVDTLFLCFLEDCERNDGSPEKPYYMSKQLMRILGKRNKRPVSNPKRK